MLSRFFKYSFFLAAFWLTACNSILNFNQPKLVENQPAVLSKDMYLCETYGPNETVAENYLTYPGNYYRYSKTLLPAVDEYSSHRAEWQRWLVLPNSKSRIVALLPKGTTINIKNYQHPNHYDELFGEKTKNEITFLSGAMKGQTIVVTSTFLRPSN